MDYSLLKSIFCLSSCWLSFSNHGYKCCRDVSPRRLLGCSASVMLNKQFLGHTDPQGFSTAGWQEQWALWTLWFKKRGRTGQQCSLKVLQEAKQGSLREGSQDWAWDRPQCLNRLLPLRGSVSVVSSHVQPFSQGKLVKSRLRFCPEWSVMILFNTWNVGTGWCQGVLSLMQVIPLFMLSTGLVCVTHKLVTQLIQNMNITFQLLKI